MLSWSDIEDYSGLWALKRDWICLKGPIGDGGGGGEGKSKATIDCRSVRSLEVEKVAFSHF